MTAGHIDVLQCGVHNKSRYELDLRRSTGDVLDQVRVKQEISFWLWTKIYQAGGRLPDCQEEKKKDLIHLGGQGAEGDTRLSRET